MKVGIFGGSGFVGNYIIKELIDIGYEVNVLIREGSEGKLEFKNKCNVFTGSIDNSEMVEEVIKNSDVIIYNIGIIREFKKENISFNNLHYEGAKLTIDLAKKYNINRYIMMSANGTCPNGTEYQTSKYKAEVYLKNNIRDWTIISPSLIFGDSNGKKEFCSELKKNMLSLPFPAPAFFPGINFISAGKFKMSPKLIQTFQKTTSNYKVSSTMVFLIKENKFRLEMQLKDSYVFDGKKRDPNTTWEIASNQVDENYVGNLLMTAFLNVKQYRTFSFSGGLNRPPSDLKGDAKEKRAVKYVDKEIKKGIYVQRIKKAAKDLNDEILSVFNSVGEFFKDSPNKDDW